MMGATVTSVETKEHWSPEAAAQPAGAHGGEPIARSVTLHTTRGKVTYLSMFFKLIEREHVVAGKMDWPSVSKWARGSKFVLTQLATISAAIGGEERRFVSVFKAAPHWILRNGWMASWVLRMSHAVLQDETGLRPFQYHSPALTNDSWAVVRLGAFHEFESRERKWYPEDKGELERAFPGPELPFRFGYAQVGKGVVLTAWRSATAAPAPWTEGQLAALSDGQPVRNLPSGGGKGSSAKAAARAAKQTASGSGVSAKKGHGL